MLCKEKELTVPGIQVHGTQYLLSSGKGHM
jgi:hypothetical protein